MIPNITFKYVWPYDAAIHSAKNMSFNFKKNIKDMEQFVTNLEKAWRPIEEKVLTEASKVSGLKWRNEKITCYVTKYNIYLPIEEPLTIDVVNQHGKLLDTNEYVDLLVHELLHYLVQYDKSSPEEKANEKFRLKYPKEQYLTKAHILLQAIHKHLYFNFFDENRLAADVNNCKKYAPSYYRAWEIIGKEGYRNVIADFRKCLKGE